MLYYKCPSCKTVLANKQIPYEIGLKKICNNSKLSEEEANAAKKALLDNLLILNMCCRPRVMSYIDLIDTLK